MLPRIIFIHFLISVFSFFSSHFIFGTSFVSSFFSFLSLLCPLLLSSNLMICPSYDFLYFLTILIATSNPLRLAPQSTLSPPSIHPLGRWKALSDFSFLFFSQLIGLLSVPSGISPVQYVPPNTNAM
ncbi:hypothetical protein BDZ94DRAFT_1268756 [Collybia nuda]|uniref:Uncharacterized protein n=1 Tax=Collybia nuda TaxID=64659 RepID=A0A9P6CEK7_9AGAR|nr:hypothetical protein BDZ94DRAFT_1268756 [Collybia nuda]